MKNWKFHNHAWQVIFTPHACFTHRQFQPTSRHQDKTFVRVSLKYGCQFSSPELRNRPTCDQSQAHANVLTILQQQQNASTSFFFFPLNYYSNLELTFHEETDRSTHLGRQRKQHHKRSNWRFYLQSQKVLYECFLEQHGHVLSLWWFFDNPPA